MKRGGPSLRPLWIIVLIVSILLNLMAVWGIFYYTRHGGSPLSDLKRLLTRTGSPPRASLPYAEANAELLERIARGEADPDRIVFLGASITQRWDFARDLPEFTILNRGVGGQFVPAILARFQRDVLDLTPRAVIIKFCSINIRPSIAPRVLEDGMKMMCDLADAHGIEPVLCTIIPVAKPAARIGDFDVRDSLSGFNDWVREFAKERGYRLLDLDVAIADENGLLPRSCAADPVHLNDEGYRILSEAIRPVLADLVGQQPTPK
jgi:lysophospholipase L1-like esterase